jgi:hypothetical protein
MNEEITAFQFDEQLDEFRCSSSDKTVKSIARDLWGCYDDLKDHKVVASKQTWDYFNRSLLLLSSKAEVEKVRSGVQWHFSQIFAGGCLVLAIFLSFRIGWKISLMEVTCPFGLVSMAIGWFIKGDGSRDLTSRFIHSRLLVPSLLCGERQSISRRGLIPRAWLAVGYAIRS